MDVQATRGALTGIRVVELADEQAEYCGLTLAGLGADVIKVEPPGGSPTRRIGPFYEDREGPERSLFFWQYNRGKRSIVLDLREERDRENDDQSSITIDVIENSEPVVRTTAELPGGSDRRFTQQRLAVARRGVRFGEQLCLDGAPNQ